MRLYPWVSTQQLQSHRALFQWNSDVTTLASWASSVVAVATVSNNAGSQGLATSVATGTTSITASYQGHTSVPATALTVTSAVLVLTAVSPLSASIALGTSQQFIATGTYTDGSTKSYHDLRIVDILHSANRHDRRSGVAVSGTLGTTTITATSGSNSGSATLSVTPATLVSISADAAEPLLAKGSEPGMQRESTQTAAHKTLLLRCSGHPVCPAW